MTGAEKLVSLMRKEGAYYNDTPPGIGEYKNGIVEFNGLKIKKKHLLVSSHLIFDDTRYYSFRSEDRYGDLYLDERDIIKNGDKLAIFYEKNMNKFVVLAKVVSA